VVATAIHFVRKVSAFILPISQKNKSGKQKQKQKAVNEKRVILDWGFPARVNQHHLHWYLHLLDLKTQI
jgi:hypothetical protein